MGSEQGNFRGSVAQAVAALPDVIRRAMDNVAILVADRPSKQQRGSGGSLLGLYEGVALDRRGVEYGQVTPDTITLFRLPILAEAGEQGLEVQQVIYQTLLHEVGHHLGFEEHELEAMGRG